MSNDLQNSFINAALKHLCIWFTLFIFKISGVLVGETDEIISKLLWATILKQGYNN